MNNSYSNRPQHPEHNPSWGHGTFGHGECRHHHGPFGPHPTGPEFGSAGPEDAGFQGGPHGGPGGPHRGRARRGQIRIAILLLVAQEPMHGYQLMQEVSERTAGQWNPSPGVVYPTITQLEDGGLVSVGDEGGRKLVTLTEEGRRYVEGNRDKWRDPFAQYSVDSPDLRALSHQLRGAIREVAVNGTDAQRQAAAELLTTTRRSLYRLLADSDS